MRSDHRATLLRTLRFSPGLFSTTFHAPELASEVRPGQFVMLGLAGRARPYLRRPYSVADADPGSGEVEFLAKTIGTGTAALEELPEGSSADLLGPLGNGFTVDDLASSSRVAVVAGGIGGAAFPLLYRRLALLGIAGDLFLGARSARDLGFSERLVGRATGRVTVTTDDGSVGAKGFVTDAFHCAAREFSYARVFACGPRPMFAALARITREMGLAAEFSTEAAMGCGFGACLGCVVPGTEKPYIISCVEGPVLPPEKVRW